MSTAFSTMRVVELSLEATRTVPYAGKLLAALGARVTVLTPPEGYPLTAGLESGSDERRLMDAVVEYLHVGKLHTILAPDEGSDADSRLGWNSAEVRQVVSDADIVLTDLRPADVAELAAVPGARVWVHVTPWGLTGPRADLPSTGFVLQAAGGWVTRRMDPQGPLTQVGGYSHEWVAGSFLAAAAATAYRNVRATGDSAQVDFSVFECIHSTVPYEQLGAETNARITGSSAPMANQLSPFGVRRCADGWVGINLLTGQQWVDACMMTELFEYADRQQEMVLGGDFPDFDRRRDEWLLSRTVNEIVELGQTMRIPVVPVSDGAMLLTLPQWQQRPWYIAQGDLQVPGPPWRLSKSPARGQYVS